VLVQLQAENTALRDETVMLDIQLQQTQADYGAVEAERDSLVTQVSHLTRRVAEVEAERDDEHRLNAKLLIDRQEDGTTIHKLELDLADALATCERLRLLVKEAVRIANNIPDEADDGVCAVCRFSLIERGHTMGDCPGSTGKTGRLAEIEKESSNA
jgi:hypothetical protein